MSSNSFGFISFTWPVLPLFFTIFIRKLPWLLNREPSVPWAVAAQLSARVLQKVFSTLSARVLQKVFSTLSVPPRLWTMACLSGRCFLTIMSNEIKLHYSSRTIQSWQPLDTEHSSKLPCAAPALSLDKTHTIHSNNSVKELYHWHVRSAKRNWYNYQSTFGITNAEA